MNEHDIGKLIETEELNAAARTSLAQYFIDTYSSLFSKGLQDAISRCETRTDVIHLLARMEKVYHHVIAPALEGRVEDISGRLPKDLLMDKTIYVVNYNGPYPTFGHALFDFRTQVDIAVAKIARRLYTSTRTLWEWENNAPPKESAKSIRYYQRNEEKIKRRFLSLFNVPPEREDEIMALSLFAPGVKSARDEYGTKRSYRRRPKEKIK